MRFTKKSTHSNSRHFKSGEFKSSQVKQVFTPLNEMNRFYLTYYVIVRFFVAVFVVVNFVFLGGMPHTKAEMKNAQKVK